MPETYKGKVKWVVYALLLLLFYVLQTTPLFLQILGIKPVLIVPFIVCLALFESEAAAAIFGIFGGLLWDLSSGRVFGFHAIILMCCCVCIALLVMYLMRNNLWNAIFFIFCVMLLEGALEYLFFYVIWSYENSQIVFLVYTLPTILYTTVTGVPIYYLMKKTATRFNKNLRV